MQGPGYALTDLAGELVGCSDGAIPWLRAGGADALRRRTPVTSGFRPCFVLGGVHVGAIRLCGRVADRWLWTLEPAGTRPAAG